MDFSVVDIVLIVPLAYGFYKGITKGFLLEIATLAGLVLGVYAGYEFSEVVNNWLVDRWSFDYSILAFALVFLSVLIALYFIAKILEKLISIVAMGWLNKIAGGVFALLKWAFVLSVLIMLFEKVNNQFTLVSQEHFEDTMLYKPVQRLAPTVIPTLKDLEVPQIPSLDSIPNPINQ